jgi:hypothetical protein
MKEVHSRKREREREQGGRNPPMLENSKTVL